MTTKIQAIIKKELPSIPKGFSGVILKGHTVIDVVSELPPIFDYLRVSFHAEWGTGRTNSGLAEISTDLSGHPLRNFKVVTAGTGKHSEGWVNTSAPFININVSRNGNDIQVRIYKSTPVTRETYCPELPPFSAELLWKYDGDEEYALLPTALEHYQLALDATIDKTHCYHCHCLHFYRSD